MRRLFSVVALLLAMSMLGPVASAQDATPAASGFADLGLPTLDVTATATGIEGFPEQLEAGRYLITLTAEEGLEFGGGFELMQPSGMTAAEFMEMMGPPSEEAGAAAVEATPVGELLATPQDEAAELGPPPPELYEATWAGGLSAVGGATNQGVLDITPGEWIVSTQDDSEPVVFEATGEMPADLPEPEAGATITMGEYLIEVTEGELVTGPQIVRIDNIGAQPHFIIWAQGPDGLTEEQIEVVLGEEMEAEMTGTPPVYSDFNPDEDLTDVTFTGTQSTGTSTWISVDVEAGTHVLICFFPDIADGMPHAYHGMYSIVEVPE